MWEMEMGDLLEVLIVSQRELSRSSDDGLYSSVLAIKFNSSGIAHGLMLPLTTTSSWTVTCLCAGYVGLTHEFGTPSRMYTKQHGHHDPWASTGRPGITPPLLDTTNRTYHKINVTGNKQTKCPSHRDLGPTTPAAAAGDPPLPDSISHSPYNIIPHVAITTAAVPNAERFTATQVRIPRHSEAMALLVWNLPEEDNFNPSSPLPPLLHPCT
ncbi:hypothetical protein BD779DRAFT_1480056 [Infundibulicybe gibba]|nr:hypothetical protein BD779DRAFT_1480056 [Infundibulicybe gibba]